jgi:hypothetical protein
MTKIKVSTIFFFIYIIQHPDLFLLVGHFQECRHTRLGDSVCHTLHGPHPGPGYSGLYIADRQTRPQTPTDRSGGHHNRDLHRSDRLLDTQRQTRGVFVRGRGLPARLHRLLRGQPRTHTVRVRDRVHAERRAQQCPLPGRLAQLARLFVHHTPVSPTHRIHATIRLSSVQRPHDSSTRCASSKSNNLPSSVIFHQTKFLSILF